MTATQTLVISGPSGVGKGTVIDALLARVPGSRLAVSATTRQPRPGEQDGVHYRFISEDAFDAALGAGLLLEHNEYSGRRYGTLAQELDHPGATVIECDINGAAALRRTLTDARFVFLAPPSLEVLEQRLRGRGTDDEASVRRRLARAAEELDRAADYDTVVVCDDLHHAVEEVLAAADWTESGTGQDAQSILAA